MNGGNEDARIGVRRACGDLETGIVSCLDALYTGNDRT
jgi:hypothetical protein